MTWDVVAILDAGGHPMIYVGVDVDPWYLVATGPPNHAASEE